MITPPEFDPIDGIGADRRLVDLGDGTMVDAIVAYRMWQPLVISGEVFLLSVYSTTRWPTDKPLRAACKCAYRQRVPDTVDEVLKYGKSRKVEIHTCGIYAYNSPGHCELLSYLSHTIVGEVLLWGTVHVHERGYRAEYAKVNAIYTRTTSHPSDHMHNELAAYTYNVPLVVTDHD